MKICPSCRQTYSDDNLNFCLTDGSFLTTSAESTPKTMYMDPPRVTNETNWGQSNYQPPPAVWQNQQNVQNRAAPGFPMRIARQDQVLPTISLVLGIFAVLTNCFGGIPLGAAAIITGVIGLNNEKADPTKYGGRGLAMGGVITGAIGFAVSIGFIILIILTS